MAPRQDQIEVVKLCIPDPSHLVGRSLAQIAQDPRFPKGSLIIGYQSHPHEDLVIPGGNTVLAAGSTILLVTKPGFIHQVIDFIQGVAG
jgi:trk system potassium uptake protein TrkA